MDADGELRLTIMSSIAQDELRKLSSRVKFGHQQAIKDSVVLGNSRIFGYVKDGGRLVIDDAEAAMVRELFELYATDQYSMKQIENIFWEKGYRNHNGKRIAHTTMSNMIANPKYKGYYVGNKVKVIDMFTKKQKFLPPEEWVMFKDETGQIVPTIVSEELWDSANEVLKRRSDDVKSRQGICNHQNLLTGKLYCTHCGAAYYRRESKDKDGIVGDSQGGGIFVDGNAYMTISGGLIDSNKSHQGSGICAWRGNVTVSNGVMSNNVAKRHGGAIYNDYSNVTITGGEFKNNTASAADVNNSFYGKGGAIFNYGDSSWPYTLTISDGDFTNNTASQTGGAICCEGTGTSEITGATFTENRAVNTVKLEADGGAVYISSGTATISGGVFENNYTSSSKEANGGAMYITGGTTTISGGEFNGIYCCVVT